jgi:hypothetical protein
MGKAAVQVIDGEEIEVDHNADFTGSPRVSGKAGGKRRGKVG